MRLLDFIEQDHLIGPAANRFGQGAAFLVLDITRGCADQPGAQIFLHMFGHIDTHHGSIVIEQKSRQSLCQLGLAYAGWSQEH